MRDEELFERGYNRVYDTIELEQNLDDAERMLHRRAARICPTARCSRATCILNRLGAQLARGDGRRARS